MCANPISPIINFKLDYAGQIRILLTGVAIRTIKTYDSESRARAKAYDVFVVRSRQSNAQWERCSTKTANDSTKLDWKAESYGGRIGEL